MNDNLIMIEPVMPTYLMNCEGYIAKIVKFVFNPYHGQPSAYYTQGVSGECLFEIVDYAAPFSALPLHPDTVPDDTVYEQFEAGEFNREFTLREFKAWGIDKVYLDPYYDRVISMEDFLDGVQKHFLDKGKNYGAVLSIDDKKILFP